MKVAERERDKRPGVYLWSVEESKRGRLKGTLGLESTRVYKTVQKSAILWARRQF